MEIHVDQAFPLEIIQEIINHIGPDNKDDLISLGLVNSAFAQMRRPLLFQKVKLDPRGLDIYHERLMGLIERNPRLSLHVRHITCDRRVYDRAKQLSSAFYLQFPNVDHLSIHSYSPLSRVEIPIPVVLHHFLSTERLTKLHLHRLDDTPIIQILNQSNLRHLELSACRLGAWHLDFSDSNFGRVESRLGAFIGSMFLDHSLPFALLYCQQLKELDIECLPDNQFGYVFGPTDTSMIPVQHRPPSSFPGLTSIICSAANDWSSFCLAAEREDIKAFHSVKNIKIRQKLGIYGRPHWGTVSTLFNHIANLETLHIEGTTEILDTHFLFFHLPLCFINCGHSLRTLYIHRAMQHYNSMMIQELCRALESAGKNAALEHFVLNLFFTEPSTTLFLPDGLECWRRLDQVLMRDRVSDFPHLRYVEISVSVPLKTLHTKEVNVKHRGHHVKYTEHSSSQYARLFDEPLACLRGANDVEVHCAVYAW
ncbi:hypothetical protein BJ165DRAFT_1451892 [Panaeolus papilionaceus]|nr:hypothetical protein BJ165DRAFT_1451892 [Panaeolus papilionaceus]